MVVFELSSCCHAVLRGHTLQPVKYDPVKCGCPYKDATSTVRHWLKDLLKLAAWCATLALTDILWDVTDRIRLAAKQYKSNFSHPLGVQPKHRKLVRVFGQVHCSLQQIYWGQHSADKLSRSARLTSYCLHCIIGDVKTGVELCPKCVLIT